MHAFDRQTEYSSLDRVCIACSAVIKRCVINLARKTHSDISPTLTFAWVESVKFGLNFRPVSFELPSFRNVRNTLMNCI